jgi:hypothetical protein
LWIKPLTREKVKKLRAIVSEGDRVASCFKTIPTPTRSSAIALRASLGRNKF